MPADLRHAALHECGHAHVAALCGVAGHVQLSVSNAGVHGSFVIPAGQEMSQAVRERIAVAGAAATALYEDPAIDVAQLARRIERLTSGFSRSDAQLCNGILSALALNDTLNWLRAHWPEVEALARREVARFGVGW